MLDSATKARIDSARDILVGKVPDPKSQVEQITIALIYKFMDDMDRQSEELGGKATFFAGEFSKYRWAQLLDKRYSGHERLLLYAEGIEKMNENKNIPQLFRDIFKGVFLPYRDPETLNLFLKEIDGFSYDHSERLGDAFEYLLSVLGTQGDAGQFRTPRHIIDFIVAVVDPKKTETVLDPACGTAGFLISAYKHILRGAKPSPPTPLPAGEGSGHYRGGFDFAGLKERARELRRTQTDTEALLWKLLRDRQLFGAKFRRQHQFGDYICDFFCEEASLVVECDGPVHDGPERQKTDHKRDAYLRSQGLTVLRFDNDRVLNETEDVLDSIASHFPSPAGRGAGGEGVASSDLTPDERARLMTNFRGYDIAPDMVRLSRVNMYLHGFPNPVIHEYDALTSEERWDERCDVIMANPPFMTPKGGIRPHNRFSIQAKRSEVLFVDYIAEHLNPGGRAGVIVPEGIIFQSQNAYKQLRRMLVENYLWAVVSLPAGVFNPYSGVKTSILFLDRNLARQRDEVLFVKVENDGFDLGAQRRPIEKNDLPAALRILLEGRVTPRPSSGAGGTAPSNDAHGGPGYTPASSAQTAGVEAGPPVIRVPRARLLESPDINLSGDRYRVAAARPTGKWPMVKMGEVVETITPLKRIQKSAYASSGTYPIIDQSQEAIAGWTDDREAVVVPRKPVVIFGDHTCAVKFSDGPFAQGADGIKILETDTRLVPKFLYFWLRTFPTKAEGYKRHFAALQRIELPLPPLDEQERIVAELEGYRKVIEGARQILAAYKPTIWVDPRWPVKPLGDIIAGKPKNGYSGKPVDRPTKVKVLSLSATTSGRLDLSKFKYLDEEIDEDSPSRCRKGDIYLQRGNTSALVGTAALFDVDEKDYVYPDLMIRVRANESVVFSAYLLAAIQSPVARTFIKNNASGSAGSMPKINQSVVESIPIPLPPLSTQRRIAAELEAERKLVEANRELIARMEAKIKTKLAEVWGETG